MRLLERNSAGKLSLTKDFIGDNIPKYAILSHTWGADTQEVTFQDLVDSTGKSKAGYSKIRFCGERAKYDGLQYFWVDTCCIDKSNSVELQEAINSMFRWYRNAVKCYVYLSDVSAKKRKASDRLSEYPWESAFRSSRWFTRGWTLQELLAPNSVEFFSCDGDRLGDKWSLRQTIHEITGITIQALQETFLSRFDVNERLLWAQNRKTTRNEDQAYALLGLFDVYMPLIYGEGKENALKRLLKKIYKPLKGPDRLPYAAGAPFNSSANQHLPTCLRNTRVELLKEIYSWADKHVDRKSIFWLNGLAGTGKSTISLTVAREWYKEGRLGASFFFSRGGGDVGHAGKFITSIAAQLAGSIPSIYRFICDAITKHSDIASRSLRDQWQLLILDPLSKLDSNGYRASYILVIDALDECDDDNDIRMILKLLAEARSLEKVRLQLFVTSRPEVPIRLGFYQMPETEHCDFVLHNILPSIIDHDISIFLKYNLGIIAQERSLDAAWPDEEVVKHLVRIASGLFIWAATACRFISEGKRFATRRLNTILDASSRILTAPEKHLDEIYTTVLKHSIAPEYTDDEREESYYMLRQILGSIAVLFSPLSICSLSSLLCITKEDIGQTLEDLHSILDIQKDQNQLLRLHHPSFRDFLLDNTRCKDPNFWVDEKQAHQTLADRCIKIMSTFLKQDICGLEAPGVLVTDVPDSQVEHCLPLEIRYACLYWIQHFQKSGTPLYDDDHVHYFLQVHFLHWLEALGWMGKTSEGIYAILSLEAQIPANKSPNLYAFVHDAKRFALYNRVIIEQGPLQIYCSALIYAPENSIIRRQFKGDIPIWIQRKPKVQGEWSAVLQTLEGHWDHVSSVAFSPDGKQVVSGSFDKTVRLWDAITGELLQTLEGHRATVTCVAFSPNGKQVVSGSGDKTVWLWDTITGESLQTLEGHWAAVTSVAFSPDGKQVISGSYDNTVWLWDTIIGALLQTLEDHWAAVTSIAFSPDGKQVVSGSDDKTVRLWDASTGVLLQTLEGHKAAVSSVAFSPDGEQVVSGSDDNTVWLWDAITGALLQMLEGHWADISSVAFSPDSKQVVSGSDDKTVRLWDASTGVLLQTLEGHWAAVTSVAFSPDGKQVISGSDDKTVRLWDATIRAPLQTLKGHWAYVNSVAFSPDGEQVVSSSYDKTVRLWDAITGALLKTLEGHKADVSSAAFSPDGKQVVSGSYDKTVRLWDASTGALLQTLKGYEADVSSVAFSPDGKGHKASVRSVAFSLDGKQVASGSYDNTVRLWDTITGELLQTLEGHRATITCVAFSPDSKQVVSSSDDKTIRLWDATTGAMLQTLEGHMATITSVVFSPDSNLLPTLLVSNDWVVEGGTKILWLPPDYRSPTCVAIWNGNIVLGYSSGRISILGFQEGSKNL